MNDPRFDRAYPSWRTGERQREEEIRALLSQVDQLAEIERALRRALEVSSEDVAADQFEKNVGASIGADAPQLLDALTRALRGERKDDVWFRAARQMIAQSLGSIIGGQSAVAEAFDAGALRADVGVEWSTFAKAFVEAVVMLGTETAWEAELARPLSPGEYLLDYRRQGVDQIPAPTSVEQVWRERWVSAPLGAKAARRLNAIALIGGSAFGRALAELPNVAVQRAALEQVGTNDLDFLFDALRTGRPVFSDGRFVNAAGLLLAEAVVAHADRLSTTMELGVNEKTVTPAELAELRGREIPEWFSTLVDVLLTRADGIRLLLELGAEFARRAAIPTGVRRSRQWPIDEIALGKFAERVISSEPLWQNLQALVEGSTNMGLLLLAAYSAAQSDASLAARCWVWGRYVDALTRSDSSLEGHVNPFGGATPWVHLAFGIALRAIPEFDAAWIGSWVHPALESRRANARFGGINTMASSTHLIRTGFAALGVALNDTPKRQQLWVHVVGSALAKLISEQQISVSSNYRDIAVAFAHVAHLFGDGWGAALERYAPIFKTDARLTLHAAALLVLNGVPKAEVLAAFAMFRVDPIATGLELIEWDGDRASPGETSAADLLKQIDCPG